MGQIWTWAEWGFRDALRRLARWRLHEQSAPLYPYGPAGSDRVGYGSIRDLVISLYQIHW